MNKTERFAISRTVPVSAAVLGVAGVLPFVGLALAPLWDLEPFGRDPLMVLALYAIVILSFMGAVHWGLAMAEFGGPRGANWGYIASVIPAIAGWFALAFLPQVVALRVIAAMFALVLIYDLRAVQRGFAPRWYSALRWPLTLVVVGSLLFASLLA